MSAPKKLIQLLERGDAEGVAKWLKARKTPLQDTVLLPLVVDAPDDIVRRIVESVLERPTGVHFLPRAMMQFPQAVPKLLAAGCPITPPTVELASTPEQLRLLIDHGWDPSQLQNTSFGWAVWARHDQAFHAAALELGIPFQAADLALLLTKRAEGRVPIDREHFEMLVARLPAGAVGASFEPIAGASNLSETAALYLPLWALEHLLEHEGPAPRAVMTPASPDREAKEALLRARGLDVPQLDARGFAAARDRFDPDDAARLLVTDEGVLGLRLGMSADDARALGFQEGENDQVVLWFDDDALTEARYSTYASSALQARPAIRAALVANYGEPVVKGSTREVWRGPGLQITCTTEYHAAIGETQFALRLQPAAAEAGEVPTDLVAFERQLLDYVRDIGPDVLGTTVDRIRVEQTGDALGVAARFANGDEARLEWSSGPLSSDGGLSEEFSAALIGALSAAQAD